MGRSPGPQIKPGPQIGGKVQQRIRRRWFFKQLKMKTVNCSSIPTGNISLSSVFRLICVVLTLSVKDVNGRSIKSVGNKEFSRADWKESWYLGDSHQAFNSWFAKQRENSSLTNLVVVKVQPKELESVLYRAKNLGFQLIAKVFDDEDFYLLRHENYGHRLRRSLKNPVFRLCRDFRIKMVVPQHAVERHRRNFHPDVSDISSYESEGFSKWDSLNLHPVKDFDDDHTFENFNDPLFKDQWYLVNRHQQEGELQHDINVLPVWRAGIDGSGIRISVLDDGVYMRNPDISQNYNSLLSFDFIKLENLNPDHVAENSHGTYCAAIAAGVANNKYCGVGVAYGAEIGGPRVLDDLISDVQEAMALKQALDYVDIYTASWGPKDDGKHLAGPGPLAQMAFVKGITQGRQGLGAIYVWASGNGGVYDDNCNADGYASSFYTLTFGAVTDNGRSTYYSEPCAAVIASTYIGGFHVPPTMKNIEELKKKINVIVPEPHGQCRENFQGTSAAAPMAAGVIALILQANPRLSWRDVQHIITECSRIPSWSEKGWSLNAAGKHFHLKMGFGVLDAARMVSVAQSWKSVKPLRCWTSKALTTPRRIKAGNVNTISLNVVDTEMDSLNNIGCLENVAVTVNITQPRRGDIELYLVSPTGTTSQILTSRRFDEEAMHIFMWNFTSLHFWGEAPFGTWKLQILNKATSGKNGFIDYFSLTLLGTSALCLSQVTPIRELNVKQLIRIMNAEENLSRNVKLETT